MNDFFLFYPSLDQALPKVSSNPKKRSGTMLLCAGILSVLVLLPLTVMAMKSTQATAGQVGDPSPLNSLRDIIARAYGLVEVMGGLTRINTDAEGVINEVHVVEGQSIAVGDPLISLEAKGAQLGLALAQQKLKAAQVQAAGDASAVPIARQRTERYRLAVKNGGLDRQSLEDAQAALRQAQSTAAASQMSSNVAAEMLKSAQWELDRRVIRAKHPGVVLRVFVSEGAAVSAMSDALMTILPQRPLQVRAEVNEYFIDRIIQGMPANISIDGEPPVNLIPTNVLRIDSVFKDSTLAKPAEGGARRVLDVILTLPEATGLRVGQHVKVDFYD